MKNILIVLLLLFSQISLSSDKWTHKLFKSIDRGNYQLASKAIKKGANINAYNDIYNNKAAHDPVLIYALKRDRLDIAKLIVSAGANINLRRKIGGLNAAMVAARRGDLSFIRFLSSHQNYNPNLVSNRNRNILFFALWNKHYNVIQFLLGNSHPVMINLNHKSLYLGRTVLERAVFQRDFRALKMLLNHDISIAKFSRSTLERAIDFCDDNKLDKFKEAILDYSLM